MADSVITLRRRTAILFSVVVFAGLAASGYSVNRTSQSGQQRGEAACEAIVTMRNALVAASGPNPDATPEEKAQRRKGLAIFDANLQPALDHLCPDADLKLGAQP